MPQHCLDMRFYGSAMRMPHVQGGFRELLVCPEAQAVPVPADLPLELAAFAEPLSVCLHAARQAGSVHGKRVLVTGVGPIGALCVLVARHGGAREIVATDLADAPLAMAQPRRRRPGVQSRAPIRRRSDRFARRQGAFRRGVRGSGAGPALAGALQVVRPCGTIVQVGIGGAT